MKPSLSLFVSMQLLFILSLFHFTVANFSSSKLSLCHGDERSALLQFKESFVINKSASGDPFAYPKVASWKPEGGNDDCCSWDGIECDEDTGHVIGLDLTSSCLYGSINSSSSLFRLVHLERLSLADNDFNDSKIPSGFGNLSRLSHLDLSFSAFSGQIPSEILELSKLVSLNLAGNSLKLQKPGLRSLAEKLTNLKELCLTGVNISSMVPHILANLSSLTSLLLRDCGLHGEFPIGIFQLPNLQSLSVRFNPYLTGYLPEFPRRSPLEDLGLAGTSFSGELPDSIGNLKSLNILDFSDCHFSGPIPSSLGNLTKLSSLDLSYNNFSQQIPSSLANLTQLTYLSLSFNSFSGGTLSWLGKQSELTHLDLAQTNSYGDIPSSLKNLTQLNLLYLYYNQLTGQITSWIGNLTQLIDLGIEGNKLHGPIPQSISRLVDLRHLFLEGNNLSGETKFDLFLKLKNLTQLDLSHNKLSVISSPSFNATPPKFKLLGLSSCNLLDFPDFLRNQNELNDLLLSHNKIHGQIPRWFWNLSNETLTILFLDSNFLTGFDEAPIVLPWTNLRLLNLSSNKLQGSLPIPQPSIANYYVSKNSLTGEISPMICDLTSLQVLDLSNNGLSGMLPQCLGNSSDSLMVLYLRNNHFHGTIPDTYMKGCKLRMIDFSRNQLEGTVPKSLANCTMLETLDLASNQISDAFPSWLGTLPELRVLIFRSNRFYGTIGNRETNFEFPKLHILDLSFNSFTGKLPSEQFQNWNCMKVFDADHLRYLQANTSFDVLGYEFIYNFEYTMTITNKGTETYYEKIQEFLVAIDLSSNRFEGHIPEDIGNLKALRLLNLSNNILTGHIPSSFGNLTELESLDLSQNKLSGEIPQQLSLLTFLAFLNVSHNRLTGHIPQGNQFDTFQNNSFDDNPGLCGNPLSRKCGNSEASPPPPPSSTAEQDKGSDSPFDFDWKVVLIGYACGLVVGVFAGHTVITRKHEWFAITFGVRQQKMRRMKRRGHGN